MVTKFIRAEDGSFIYVPNITKLAVDTDYNDKAKIRAHQHAPGMPFTVATFETSREAHAWMQDIIERIEASEDPK